MSTSDIDPGPEIGAPAQLTTSVCFMSFSTSTVLCLESPGPISTYLVTTPHSKCSFWLLPGLSSGGGGLVFANQEQGRPRFKFLFILIWSM